MWNLAESQLRALLPPFLLFLTLLDVNGTLRLECLDAHRFASLAEAKEIIEAWRREYNESRPHRAHGERTPQAQQLPETHSRNDAEKGDRSAHERMYEQLRGLEGQTGVRAFRTLEEALDWIVGPDA